MPSLSYAPGRAAPDGLRPGPCCPTRPIEPVSPGGFHAHGLRHTHTFNLANEGDSVNEGRSLHVIQAQLPHSSLAITAGHNENGTIRLPDRVSDWMISVSSGQILEFGLRATL